MNKKQPRAVENANSNKSPTKPNIKAGGSLSFRVFFYEFIYFLVANALAHLGARGGGTSQTPFVRFSVKNDGENWNFTGKCILPLRLAKLRPSLQNV